MFSFERADVSRDSLIVSESQKVSFSLAFTDDEGVPRNVCSFKTEHWPPFLSLSPIKTVFSCVVQIVCVITNQGSGNPNCLNFLKGAYKVYQGVPPTYFVNCNVKQIVLRGRLQMKGESEEFFKQVLNNSADRFNADPHHDTDWVVIAWNWARFRQQHYEQYWPQP